MKCSRMWPSLGVSSSICFLTWVHRRCAGLPQRRWGGQQAEPLLQVVLGLSRASAQLAAFLEPREHGATSPVSHIREAIEDLHASAEALAAVFAVDLARAHQARLEALLGAPLPVSLVEEQGEGR